MLFTSPGQFKRVGNDAVAGPSRKNIFLDDHFKLSAAIEPSAHFRVLSFTVLANDDEVDVSRLPATERTVDPFQQPCRATVYVLFESPPDRNQQAPQGDVVRHAGITHRA